MTMPVRRHGRAVFWIAVLFFASVVASIFFLANDMRNLKALVRHYDFHWFDASPAMSGVGGNPGVRHLPLELLGARSRAAGDFLRRWPVSGPDLCAKLQEAGIANGGWGSSDFGAGTFECIGEATFGGQGDAASFGSFFLVVRGTPSGEIALLRTKVIVPVSPDGEKLRTMLRTVLGTVMDQTLWRDLQQASEAVGRLEPVSESGFGSTLTFSREFSSQNSYNLLLTVQAKTTGQRRTASYFNPERWLALAPASLSELR